MLHAYDKSDKKDKKLTETVTFIKQKLDSAKWFIDAIRQRQQTLLNTMQAIIDFQYDYFLEGDESTLKPMILKDISDKNSKWISQLFLGWRAVNLFKQTLEYLPLKYFFSEGISTESGEDVSSREVKNKLREIIDAEE